MNRFRYLNTSISYPRCLLCTRLMKSRSWIRCWYCGFWFQESSLLLFSVSSPFHQCLALNVGTRIALHVRNVGGLGICIMGGSVLCFCTCMKLRAWTPGLCWPFRSFPLFVFATCGLWWWWFLDPAVVVSDVHHRTFIYIETHLPLVRPLNKFIGIIL